MDAKAVHVPDEKIEQFCRKHHIRKLSFFGSVVRDDFGSHSDIDVLVEFEPEHTPGWRFFLMEAELSEILGRKVDLQTANFLSPQIRGHAIAEAVAIYDKT
ncbi:MAG: nucleotidyltransferase family protein [Chloroflexota bacterium]